MHLAAAVDHLRTLADSSHPLAAGATRDAQLRTALKTVLDHCDSDLGCQMERDELALAAGELHDLLDRAADVLDAYPGPFEPDGDWNVYTLARQAREALELLTPSELGARLLAELDAARAWRLAEQSWQQVGFHLLTQTASGTDSSSRGSGGPRNLARQGQHGRARSVGRRG